MYSLMNERLAQYVLKQQPIKIDPTNEEMTISQVIKFFLKYDMCFTKTMIQNYIRIGLLPGPVQKRYYTENHLMLLFLIYHLKEAFALDEIKKVFGPILQDEDTFEDDLITPGQLYHLYGQLQQHIMTMFCGEEHAKPQQLIEEIVESSFAHTEQRQIVQQFIMVFYTMILTIVSQKIGLALSDNLFS